MNFRNIIFRSFDFIKNNSHPIRYSKYIFATNNECLPSEVTAGVIIIGDEILKGTPDLNTPFLIKQLNSCNVKVCKVSVVPDNVNVIAKEVSELSSNCSFVITSGGIGPTHDDVTYEAIAKAFNDELQLNEELFKLLVTYFGAKSTKNPGIIKYSHIPKSAKLNYININYNDKMTKFPLVSVRNVFIFPGIPVLLQKSFDLFKSQFIFKKKSDFTCDIFINLDEFAITGSLNDAVQKFNGYVKFGSYPAFINKYYKVKLTLESSSEDWIKKACGFFNHELPNNSILDIRRSMTFERDIYSLCEVLPCVAEAVTVIEQSLEKYLLSELCLCFNGGKDCTALLHLLYSCVQVLQPDKWNCLKVLYVKNGKSFNEIEMFIQNTTKEYNFNIITSIGNLKDAVSSYLKAYPDTKAILMGTRKYDPGASDLNHFCTTDSDWPFVTRILPLLNWSYSDVWFFIQNLQIPYCILYDKGYTSLGVKSETIQNPSLLLKDDKGSHIYKPAYMLEDTEKE